MKKLFTLSLLSLSALAAQPALASKIMCEGLAIIRHDGDDASVEEMMAIRAEIKSTSSLKRGFMNVEFEQINESETILVQDMSKLTGLVSVENSEDEVLGEAILLGKNLKLETNFTLTHEGDVGELTLEGTLTKRVVYAGTVTQIESDLNATLECSESDSSEEASE